ncbi:MAG: bifunctional phosphoglucose/phosphomannose isomerase [Bacteroidia bacterium]|jgi:glucose/mannose-6-phosphate isomerase
MNEQHTALAKFGYQIRYALEHYQDHGLKVGQFHQIVIAGLGGSGIGGNIARSIFRKHCPITIECVADYTLPAYVNEHTLVILNSYSGNTEETLSVYHSVLDLKCTVLAISSGGKLSMLAKESGIHLSVVESGFQPRMALGFSLTYLILILSELLNLNNRTELLESASAVENSKMYQEEAHAIFESIKTKLKHKLIVLTDAFFEPIGIRFAQQIQENAKHECFQHTLPEMNHNVIESYYGQLESIFFLLDSHQNSRVTSRFEFLNNLLEVEYNKVIQIPVELANIKTVYEIIHLLDWLSLYIADFRKVDSLNVPNIASLKEFLETVGE